MEYKCIIVMEEISLEVIRKCQNGTAEAFAPIVEKYERQIFSYVYKFFFGAYMKEEAEDSTQEIFIKAYSNMDTFDLSRGTKFSTWLYTIARNHCLSVLRRHSRRSKMIDTEVSEPQDLPDSKSSSPQEKVMEKELSQKVANALALQSEEQKSTVLFQYYEGLTYGEIAHIRNCSIGTVKSRLARAREKLHRNLKEYLCIR